MTTNNPGIGVTYTDALTSHEALRFLNDEAVRRVADRACLDASMIARQRDTDVAREHRVAALAGYAVLTPAEVRALSGWGSVA